MGNIFFTLFVIESLSGTNLRSLTAIYTINLLYEMSLYKKSLDSLLDSRCLLERACQKSTTFFVSEAYQSVKHAELNLYALTFRSSAYTL